MVEQRSIDSKVLAWYEFTEGCRILYIGKKDDKLFGFLKDKKLQVELEPGRNQYDYLIYINNFVDVNKITENMKYLKDDGIILVGFNNKYGISKFLSYDSENRVSALEKDNGEYASIKKIKQVLENTGYIHSNLYMPFPNINRVDMICTNKIDNISDKIDKYFVEYDDEMTVLAREIDLLRNISIYNIDTFECLANSYLMEFSKNNISTDVKYVSYNNYRKEEYQLITIIEDDVVEKKPATYKSINNIKRIGEELKYLNNYNIEILDKYENNKLYSTFIKERKTYDVELSNYANSDELISKLNDYKEIFKNNSVKFDKSIKREFIEPLKKENEEILNKLNYLEYAFYDMVPKNCFYIDNKYYFFDQEWMEKYLPVEFIIYRSIINSYDLVKKIDVDKLLEKIGLLEYRELFDRIENYLRKRIVDEEKLKKLNKNYRKMYEELYDKKVLEIKNNELKVTIENQNQYIKELQEDV